jgi:hypothetical protein
VDVLSVVRLARRWWYLVLPMLFVTAGLALLVAQSVPVTYQAKGSVLFEPPAPTAVDKNGNAVAPANKFGNEVFAAQIMATVMNDTSVKDTLKKQGASDYVVGQTNDQIPLLDITAEGDSQAQVLQTIKLVADGISAQLVSQQTASAADPASFITTRPLLATDRADSLYGGRVRAGFAVGALGLAATFSMPFLMEGLSRSRRRQANEWTEQLYTQPPSLPSPTETREPATSRD